MKKCYSKNSRLHKPPKVQILVNVHCLHDQGHIWLANMYTPLPWPPPTEEQK